MSIHKASFRPFGRGFFVTWWILLQLLLFSSVTKAFQFYLHAGEKRCFTESAPANTKILGEYTVSTGKGQMPVDITVRLEGQRTDLYSRKNVDHGKFAFVLPYESSDIPKIHKAEMHRKLTEQMHKLRHRVQNTKLHGQMHGFEAHVDHEHNQQAHQRRRLLSVDQQAGHHDEHLEDDEDEYDYEDDLDEFDSEEYDGIHDEDLDEELERFEQEELKHHGRMEDISDAEKEERLFNDKKFEICVLHEGEKAGFKRRVRLIVHKGADAHDYTRLAKKEQLTQLEVSLREVSGELHELMNELDQARQMEDVLRQLNENTNKRVVVFAIISLLSLFAVGGYQAMYTKRFFKRKKIL